MPQSKHLVSKETIINFGHTSEGAEKQEMNKAQGRAESSQRTIDAYPDQVSQLAQPFPPQSAFPFSRNRVQEPQAMQTPANTLRVPIKAKLQGHPYSSVQG